MHLKGKWKKGSIINKLLLNVVFTYHSSFTCLFIYFWQRDLHMHIETALNISEKIGLYSLTD